MTEIEGAYKQVYDDLDKRKTQKGWERRKMGWVKGDKVLKELLVSYVSYNPFQHILPPRLSGIEVTVIDFRQQDPPFPGSKGSEWSAWNQDEVSRDQDLLLYSTSRGALCAVIAH
jgi:hypothetical protein